MTISRDELQPGFKFEVAARGGELVKRCFDCGTCTGACPVSKADPAFDPRKILHMIRLGLKDRLLGSKLIGYCTHCDTCAFVCPQEVRFSGVIRALRELAIQQGYVEPAPGRQWSTAPCKATCPAGISIPGFIAAISQGRYAEGLRLIKKEMPFAAVCGRVCPHPCEGACNRAAIDEPVSIMYLKRFLADVDLAAARPHIPRASGRKQKKVAVIGAGPAGLTAAYYLALDEYPVTVFERFPVAGGMMAVGIPEYRLPRSVLQAEIDTIRDAGVEIKLNCEIGKDVDFEEIHRDHQAIFIGTGCHRSLKLKIPGEDDLDGITDALAFLRDVNLGSPPGGQGRVLVIGGGNAAVDCARLAVRLGYKDPAILYRRTREEMPAYPWEVDEGIEEGVSLQFLTAPVRFIGEGGKVCGVECVKMSLAEPDASGRRRPVAVAGSEFTVPADLVVTAIGQAPDLGFLPGNLGVRISERELLEVDALTTAAGNAGIFAGGDVASGPRTVVEAVAFGKKAAGAIDRYLRGEKVEPLGLWEWQGGGVPEQDGRGEGRQSMPCLSLPQRKRTFREIHLGFGEEEARREAGRCLQICGIRKGS